MLQALREKTSGLIAKIVLGALIFVFSFFGIESYFQSRNETWVAKVGDREISPEQFRKRFDDYRRRVTAMMGGQVDGAMFESAETKQRVLNGLIDEQVVLAANEKLGLVVADERIQKEIRDVPSFQADGKFDPALYKAALSNMGESPTSFQERVREDLASRELPSQLAASTLVTPRDVENYIRLRDQTRDLRYVNLPKPDAASTKVTDAEIETYFKDHTSEFMTPEQVALDYLELDATTLKTDAAADEATLKERYEKEKARYVAPEQRLTSHLLVAAKGGDAEAQKKALAKAQELVAKVRGGTDFAAVAKESSEDLGSKAQGGDLGWLEKGVTDPAFESALFAMNKGDISEPVLSAEGYHVIQLRDVRAEKTRSFDEVKAELGKDFLDAERERVFNDVASKLTDAVYENPTSLDPAAKAISGVVKKTDLFSRQGGTGIAANPAVVKAAFSDAVLVEGNTSDAIDLGAEHKVVVRIAEHKPSTPKPLDSVREEIRGKLVAEAVSKQAKSQAESVLARLNKGETLDQLAAELKLKVAESKAIGRNAANLDARMVAAAFKLPRPAAGKPSTSTVAMADNAFALLAVDAVADGDPGKVDQAARDVVREQLKRNDANRISAAFVQSLRQQMKVQIAQDRLQ
ncbi:MAG: SurA N-terminal domain-containing protein [Tahibacter sp.]